MEKIRVGFEMANTWTDPPIVIIVVAFGGSAALLGASVCLAQTFDVYCALVPWLITGLWYNYVWMKNEPADTAKYLKFNCPKAEKLFAKSRIPISHLYEYYIDADVEFKGDVLHILQNHRDEFVSYKFTFDMLLFLVKQFVGPMSSSFKNITATTKEIAAHYDRGNDFFRAFLGPRMVYTSGVYYECPSWSKSKGKAGDMKQIAGTSLEEAQDNKMSLICEKLQLKAGDSYLDIGCGWGTLMRHAAREFGANSVGVTLSSQGAAWCNAQIKAEGLQDTAEILIMDYRMIPKDRKFQAISAIEMAEHVGIANFQLFLGNIYDMLEDDGMYLMQVAGLRKGANWQDTQWGLFMSKYIFPGADASTPLNW
jgi:cyclopropane fatty-acyl-phospholipid synthase-like methyltransferase